MIQPQELRERCARAVEKAHGISNECVRDELAHKVRSISISDEPEPEPWWREMARQTFLGVRDGLAIIGALTILIHIKTLLGG